MASIFRRPISHAKPQAQNKGMREDLPSKWTAKKAGVAILVSHKIDFKATKIKKKKQRRTSHNKKRINTTRRANDPKKYMNPIQEHPDI